MDMEEIQYLLGSAIFAWAKNYVKRIESYEIGRASCRERV
mgnify:CR=1 FL=1